jgi:hypothetical protein
MTPRSADAQPLRATIKAQAGPTQWHLMAVTSVWCGLTSRVVAQAALRAARVPAFGIRSIGWGSGRRQREKQRGEDA